MSVQGYDIVGDIHGQAAELEQLLITMGYKLNDDAFYAHDERKVIFLGDFVDRGTRQRDVLEIVRPMIDSGAALSVMGNHEFNAIAYYTKNTQTGAYLRDHSSKNKDQHEAFLKEYEKDAEAHKNIINWFMSLPLWLDLDGLRIIHACWDSKLIDRVRTELDGQAIMSNDFLHRSCHKDNWEFEAVETLLKGKEIPLKKGFSFKDKDENIRHNIRVRWWDQNASTYQSAFMGPESARTHIPDDEIDGDHLVEYSHNQPPVFLGHYWMEGEPAPLASNIACLDYSVAKPGGKLAAYRWDGEQVLSHNKFICVDRPTDSFDKSRFT